MSEIQARPLSTMFLSSLSHLDICTVFDVLLVRNTRWGGSTVLKMLRLQVTINSYIQSFLHKLIQTKLGKMKVSKLSTEAVRLKTPTFRELVTQVLLKLLNQTVQRCVK